MEGASKKEMLGSVGVGTGPPSGGSWWRSLLDPINVVCSCASCLGIMCTRINDELESTSDSWSSPPDSVLGLSSALGGPAACSSGPGTSLHIGAGTRESSREMRLTDPSALTTPAQRVRASESQAWLRR